MGLLDSLRRLGSGSQAEHGSGIPPFVCKVVIEFYRRQGLHKLICVIDGQGGGIGASLIKYIRGVYGEPVEIAALGTNAIAASMMIKAGANRGASGENAIVRAVAEADVIVGMISITWTNAMLGEITPRMAEAVMSASALKILLPLSQERVIIAGVYKEPLPHLVKSLVEDELREVLNHV